MSPTIDTGVLGVHVTPSFETEHVTDETVNAEQDAFVDSSSTAAAAQAELVTDDDVDASWAARFATDSGAGGGGGGAAEAEAAQSTGELTVRMLTNDILNTIDHPIFLQPYLYCRAFGVQFPFCTVNTRLESSIPTSIIYIFRGRFIHDLAWHDLHTVVAVNVAWWDPYNLIDLQ